MEPTQPTGAWKILREGNDRFVRGEPTHPHQDAARRNELEAGQQPRTVILGCSDSRVAPEILFDQGLGDVFIIRTAGHVLDPGVIGTIEYGTEVLGATLLMVLGHTSCGAVEATAGTLASGEQPPGYIGAVVDRIIPSVAQITRDGAGLPAEVDPDVLRTAHVRHTVAALTGYSTALREGVSDGRLSIIGVEYDLADGKVRLVEVQGDVGEQPEA
ncbi:MAG: carbonic anhydrase [Micrococcales bacterium]|nr:carbonic anhydrase [Micrococcales bacterium]